MLTRDLPKHHNAPQQAFAVALAQSVPSALDSFVFSLATYFLVGFDPSAAGFLTYFLVCLATNLSMGGVYRLLAAASPVGACFFSGGGALLPLFSFFWQGAGGRAVPTPAARTPAALPLVGPSSAVSLFLTPPPAAPLF